MWTPERPVKEIGNKRIEYLFVEEAKYLLKDLIDNIFKTGVERDEYERIKKQVLIHPNPVWYQELVEKYSYHNKNRRYNKSKKAKRKKPDSLIKRKRVIPSLERISKLEDRAREIGYKKTPGREITDTRLRTFMYERFTEGYEEGGRYHPQNVIVCGYFNVVINRETREMLKGMKKEDREEKKFNQIMDFFDKKGRK